MTRMRKLRSGFWCQLGHSSGKFRFRHVTAYGSKRGVKLMFETNPSIMDRWTNETMTSNDVLEFVANCVINGRG